MEHAARVYPNVMLPHDLPDGAFDRYLHRRRGAASNLLAFRSYLVERGMAPPELPEPRSSPSRVATAGSWPASGACAGVWRRARGKESAARSRRR